MGQPNDHDSDGLKELKRQLQDESPKSPADETPGGIGRQREIIKQMDAERSRQDQARNDETTRQEAARWQDASARMGYKGGGSAGRQG